MQQRIPLYGKTLYINSLNGMEDPYITLPQTEAELSNAFALLFRLLRILLK